MKYVVALVYDQAKIVEAESPEAAARHAFDGGEGSLLGWEAMVAPFDSRPLFELAPVPKQVA